MTLWILRPIKDHPNWECPYGHVFGFVIRADTEEKARRLAQENGADDIVGKGSSVPAWTDATYSTCEKLLNKGQKEVIMRDYCHDA